MESVEDQFFENTLKDSIFKISGGFNNSYTYIIFVTGIQGLGKSSVFKVLKKKFEENDLFDVVYISTDLIREELYNEEIKENPNANYSELFELTRLKTKKMFFKMYQKEIDISIKNKIKIILADKMLNIESIISINTKQLGLKKIKIIIFYPLIKHKTFNEFPFDLNYLVQCYQRVKNRSHSVFDGSKIENILTSILQYLITFRLEKYDFSLEQNFDEKGLAFFPISFIDNQYDLSETEEFQLIQNVLNKAIVNVNSTSNDKTLTLNIEIVNEIRKILDNILEKFKFSSTLEKMNSEINYSKFLI